MKRLVLALTLAGVLGSTVQPAMAQNWGYAPGYGYSNAGYGYANNGYQSHPVLRNLLIAGGSFGLGFVAGRATALQPYGGYGYGVPAGYGPAYGHPAPWGGYHW